MVVGRRRVILAFFAATAFIFMVSLRYRAYISRTISYASRPLWDSPDGPHSIVPHFHADGLQATPELCALHGWTTRSNEHVGALEVWDAVLFSGELELLEIRLNELDPVVDKFFILESNRTFTGLLKDLVFDQHRLELRFSKFTSKIVYQPLLGPPSTPDEDPWKWEAHQRNTMTSFLHSQVRTISQPPLLIFSDVDEIPSAHTLRLLKACLFPSPLHLQMRTYLYSFEWPVGWGSWRAQVHEWDQANTYYRHSKAGGSALADAGWHCSYCFRRLQDFANKMKGFSHADRLAGDMSLLSPERIQRVICEGKDIFDMLPEAYSYKDMIQLLNPEPAKTAVGLPRFIIENAERFKFLLPGGCVRDE